MIYCCAEMRFYVYCVVTAIVTGTLKCLFTLQSSIQVKRGIGVMSLGAYYALGIPGSIIIYPFLLRIIGRKYNLILGDACAMCFGLALLFPATSYGAIYIRAIVGLFEPSLWCAAYAIAANYDTSEDEGRRDGNRTRNVARFMAITGFVLAIANMVPELVLKKSMPIIVDGKEAINLNISIYCGANDCASAYSAREEHPVFHNLIPSKQSIYILVGVIAVLQMSVMVIHFIMLPSDALPGHPETDTLVSKVNHKTERENIDCKLMRGVLEHLKISLSTIGLSFLSLSTLLAFSSHLHLGFYTGFRWSVFSRSFIACPLGVDRVGLCMFIDNFMSASVSLLVGKVCEKISLRALTCTGFIFDFALCGVMIAWTPNGNTLYVPYLLAVLTGLCQGLSRTLSGAIASSSGDVDTAFTIRSAVVSIGIMISQFLAAKVCTVTLIIVIATSSLISTCTLIARDCLYSAE